MHALAALAVFLLSFSFTAQAGSHDASPYHRRAVKWERGGTTSFARRDVQYQLEDDYTGQQLIDGFTFFNGVDPTHGTVTYVDATTAKNEGLAVVQDGGIVQLSVDTTTVLQSGQPRKSVRIQSTKTYNSGLFIADFYAMPHGCAVWPAYWTVGQNQPWPLGGELDIIEGVNTNTNNQITGHTGPSCNLTNTASAQGDLLFTKCTSSASDNLGCVYHPTGNATYGHPFNMNGGGVYAHLWNSDGISVWFFPRGQIPQDVTSGNPDPSSWGAPTALFPNNDSCNLGELFQDHALVINTSLCGDWAGGGFTAGGCGPSCADFVADPSNFKYAHWSIASIKVYQPQN
ncbi:glycoside hydrolase family 16 protein [Cytidiella melzeri]|nr:glycoside hydrolase family 16 protein [Cytidiella melzeri]